MYKSPMRARLVLEAGDSYVGYQPFGKFGQCFILALHMAFEQGPPGARSLLTHCQCQLNLTQKQQMDAPFRFSLKIASKSHICLSTHFFRISISMKIPNPKLIRVRISSFRVSFIHFLLLFNQNSIFFSLSLFCPLLSLPIQTNLSIIYPFKATSRVDFR